MLFGLFKSKRQRTIERDWTKATNQERLDYARKKYKIGDKIVNAWHVLHSHGFGDESIIPDDKFYLYPDDFGFGPNNIACDGAGFLYLHGRWAKKVK